MINMYVMYDLLLIVLKLEICKSVWVKVPKGALTNPVINMGKSY